MISPRRWIEDLRERAPRASGGIDPESVHQVRVAAGRLSVWLELGGRRMLRDDLAWLRCSASRARDLDVVVETLLSSPACATSRIGDSDAGAERARSDPWAEWRAHLGREREIATLALRQALASARFRGLLAALSWMPALDPETARKSLARFRCRVERAESKLERKPEDLGALHRLRRAVRRLRYALEWIGEDAATWKALQDELGELNDLELCLRLLDADESAATVNATPARRSPPKSDLEREVAEQRTRILDHWSRTRAAVDEC